MAHLTGESIDYPREIAEDVNGDASPVIPSAITPGPHSGVAAMVSCLRLFVLASAFVIAGSAIASGQNTPPTSAADADITAVNTALTVTAPGVLANDLSDTPMTAAVVATPANGTVTLGADGGFTYTPNAGFFGSDMFTYRATNTAGAGATTMVTMTVAGPGVPLPPKNFRIVAMSGNTVTLAWTPSTVGPAPNSYRLDGGVSPGSVLGSLPIGAGHAVTLALPSGSFFIRLHSVATAGASVSSNEIPATVNVPSAPSAPTNLLGMAAGNELGLAWTPTFGGGNTTTRSVVVSGAFNGTLPAFGDAFRFRGVPPGTYTFQVQQVNASGTSSASSPVTLTFPGTCATGAPLAPANFQASNQGGVLMLTWDLPPSGSAPTSFLIGVSGSFFGILSVPSVSRMFSAPPPPGTYTFTLTALNACGPSAPAPEQTVTFP